MAPTGGSRRSSTPSTPNARRAAQEPSAAPSRWRARGAGHVWWRERRIEISSPGGFPEDPRLDNLLITHPPKAIPWGKRKQDRREGPGAKKFQLSSPLVAPGRRQLSVSVAAYGNMSRLRCGCCRVGPSPGVEFDQLCRSRE